jgi:hypothetical protein
MDGAVHTHELIIDADLPRDHIQWILIRWHRRYHVTVWEFEFLHLVLKGTILEVYHLPHLFPVDMVVRMWIALLCE